MWMDFWCTKAQAGSLNYKAELIGVTPEYIIKGCLDIAAWVHKQTGIVGTIVDPLPTDRDFRFRIGVTKEDKISWEDILFVTNVSKTKLIYGALRDYLPFMARPFGESYFEQLFKDAVATQRRLEIEWGRRVVKVQVISPRLSWQTWPRIKRKPTKFFNFDPVLYRPVLPGEKPPKPAQIP